jgi:hypothetical protein
MGNKKIAVFLILIVAIFSSCGRLDNPKERNSISFNDGVDSVAIAIEKMNYILDSSNVSNFFWYAVSSMKNSLYISHNYNRKNVGLLTDTTLYKSEDLFFIQEKKEFIRLVIFLENNNISRCDYENGDYIYLYRGNIYMADRQKDLWRFIMLTDDIRNINLDKYKVLDNKDNLFLLADKDAEIYDTSTD